MLVVIAVAAVVAYAVYREAGAYERAASKVRANLFA